MGAEPSMEVPFSATFSSASGAEVSKSSGAIPAASAVRMLIRSALGWKNCGTA